MIIKLGTLIKNRLASILEKNGEKFRNSQKDEIVLVDKNQGNLWKQIKLPEKALFHQASAECLKL